MAEQKPPIHFRFTHKADPWKVLMNALDGRDSINVSLEEHKGMSLKDSDKIAIPSFVYKDLWNDAYLSVPGTGTFLVVADNTSNSLRLVDFSAIDVEEINALLSSNTPEDDTIYFYRNGQGFAYTTIGTQILYGNYFSKEVPSSDDSMSFVDWRGYLDKINAAYISDANSFNVFSKHEGLAPRSYMIQRYANSFGFFQTNLRTGYTNSNYIIGFGKGNTAFAGSSLPSSIKEYILNGLHVDTDTSLANTIDASCSGLGHIHISDAYRMGAIYGRIDAGDNNVYIYGLTTGSREVALGSKITNGFVDIFNCSFQVSDDVELNDISRPVKELINKQDTTLQYLVDTRLKTIRKDRTGASATINSIYTTDKDFICGYNNMTGKCLCMTLEEEVPEVIIHMPLYVNATGMDVVGLTAAGGLAVTNSLKQYATISKSSVPIINWNPQRLYQSSVSGSYQTLADAEAAKTDPDDKILYNEQSSVYQLIKVSPTKEIDYVHACFSLASINSVRTNYIGWSNEVTSYDPNAYILYDDLSIKIPFDPVKYKGLEVLKTNYKPDGEIIVVAFVRFDSNENFDMYTGTRSKDWHWHYYRVHNDISSHTLSDSSYNSNSSVASQNTVYYLPNQVQTVYNLDHTDSSDATTTAALKRDHWYAMVETSVTNTYSPKVAMLDICYKGTDDVCEEFVEFISSESSSVNRYCRKTGDTYKFSISVADGGGDSHTFQMHESDVRKYFTIVTDNDGNVTDIRLNNKKALITDHPEVLYRPLRDVCVNIDVEMKTKYIYNQQMPICIPEFSGCVFVKV